MTLSIRTRLTLWYTGILLVILLVISGLSYSLLRWSLMQDVDASLVTVAQVIRDTSAPSSENPASADQASPAESLLRELLGPEFYDKFFQVVDPDGRPGARSTGLGGETLPLSPRARSHAARGLRTFETVRLGGRDVRLLTIPILHGPAVARLVQVGMSLERAERALHRYLQTLLVLIPLGIVLAAVGGGFIARRALHPVDEMSRTARRITGEDLARRIALAGTGDELDRLAETLNAMLARLEGAFGTMRRFAADAAHELRTPLTALRGGIEVALRADRSADEYRRVLTSSLEDVERLIRLAEDLLLLSRFSAGGAPSRARVDIEPLVVDVLDLGVRLGAAHGVSVRLDGVAPAVVIGDAQALRRALVNLVDNAVKYTPAGGKVELASWSDGGRVHVSVTDTGIGIAPDERDQLFRPFVRLASARSAESPGSGLGLVIARSIIASHGGTLSMESAPGAGSTFTIELPDVMGGLDGPPKPPERSAAPRHSRGAPRRVD